ncbi:MAG TPA: CoA ester lyase [Noviherbaspirillum sp.]|uniref:HpcH/HpaI aldolase/citrate lyase family protein n=1 Tax=Noviherbaspirillum sp. TaxID=1926288 RepID=UPI002B470441|nr:CoA ester lyase [Noviherbaspirillum sp.]HJV84176.1 CoA ester lyase [Noviherbaspirillum sp.]
MENYQRPKRLRRVQLAVPGSSEKMMAKAAASGADHVFLDLEDAVAPNAKVGARSSIVTALRTLDWGKKTRCVRINDLSTQWAYEDIIHIVEEAGEFVDTIMVPKVMSACDVRFVATLLRQIEKKTGMKRQIGIEALIEEVEAMQEIDNIARADPRLECIIFGAGDYSASQGIDIRSIGGDNGYPGDIWHFARFKLVVAARSAGIDPVDGPFANFKNPDAYREECRRAMILGCVGKWAIHPAQIDVAIDAFSPKPEEVERARKLEAAYAKAEAEGMGSVNIDGIMVDAASVRIVRNIIKKADLIGM